MTGTQWSNSSLKLSNRQSRIETRPRAVDLTGFLVRRTLAAHDVGGVVHEHVDLEALIPGQLQFLDAKCIVQLHVGNENAVDEGDQGQDQGTHATLAVGHRGEGANALNRHEHEDQHGDLRVSGIVGEHRQALPIDHFPIVDDIDELREIDVEATR